MSTKIKKILYWAIGLLIVFFIAKVVLQFALSFKESAFYSPALKKEYVNLLSKEEQGNLSVVWNYNSEVRNQISIFDYGKQKKYSIAFYKIPIEKNFSIKNITIKKTKNRNISAGFVYTNIGMGTFELNYKSGRPPIARNISFSYNGDLLKQIRKNDSMISFFLKFKNFSLSYNDKKTKDIFGKTVFRGLPLEVLFLKRNDALYLLLMSVNDHCNTMPQNLLNNLISGKIENSRMFSLSDSL